MRRLEEVALPLVAATLLCACSAESGSSDPELEIGRRYVEERSFRRDALERSLAVRSNREAELRLNRYAVPGEWEDLPEHAPLVSPVGEPAGEMRLVWNGDVEWTRDALLELGRTAFDLWPAQVQPVLASVIDSPARARGVGLWSDERGRIGGVVLERHADGGESPAFTCASCHARVEADGTLLRGPASDLDIGALLHGDRPPTDDSGAGRVDVTADGSDNPVSIPDLRATRHQRRLHWSGNLENGLDALAVRIETLLITSSSETVRPPRPIAFALAFYIWSMGEEPRGAPDAPGQRALEQHCGRCHSGSTGEGDPIDARVVGTDPAVTLSPARGTGSYRVPSLYRVGTRSRLTHEGRFADLDSFLNPLRALDDPAHPFGLDLAPEERADLIAFLKSL